MSHQPPKFFKPRSVPYELKRKVEEELDRLVQTKVIEPVRYSDWATPIVPVLKADGKVRVCGDYKLTVNRVSHLEQYPIPTLDDLCEKIDRKETIQETAYSQLPLDEKSKGCHHKHAQQIVVWHQFGTNYIPEDHGKYQYVAEYLDDIILTGATKAQHLETLDMILGRLEEAGLRLKRKKCIFLAV